jgi:hypothetical protein
MVETQSSSSQLTGGQSVEPIGGPGEGVDQGAREQVSDPYSGGQSVAGASADPYGQSVDPYAAGVSPAPPSGSESSVATSPEFSIAQGTDFAGEQTSNAMAADNADAAGSVDSEATFEGGTSTGPFTPAGPNQSVNTSPPAAATGEDDIEEDDDAIAPSPPRPVNTSGVPFLADTGFQDLDQFANQQEIDRAFNDAVFGQGDYDAQQQRLQATIDAIDNAIPSDAFIIAGGEAKSPIFGGVDATVEAFGVAGLDRSTYESYVGGAVVGGPSLGPVTISGGAEWTTEEGANPIGIVNIGGEAGAGGFITPEEWGVYVYVGEPFFVGIGFGWAR